MIIYNKVNKIINISNKEEKKRLCVFFYKLIFILLEIKIIFHKKINIVLKNPYDLKVCLCTLGKMENKYAREFVEHYKKYDIDKIFIYDNNELNGETFDLILSDYIKNKYVQIINYRGKNKIQIPILNDCYRKNSYIYDWFLFYDMDEFIYLKNYKSIKLFLNEEKFQECNIIHLNWVNHLDNNQIYYSNESLFKRFPKYIYNETYAFVKSMIRGHKSKIIINNNHIINSKYSNCDEFGFKKKFINIIHTEKPDYKNYYIDHFYYKSTEEFINKINRGDCFYGNISLSLFWIKRYFQINEVTLDKIKYFEKKSNLNLTSLKYKFLKNLNL
jgi:hypothetical protein